MPKAARIGVLVGAGVLFGSFTTTTDYSSAAVPGFDPVRWAQSICSSRGAVDLLKEHLRLASLIATPASAQTQTLALYDDLSGPRMAVTTSSGTARRYFNQGLMLNYGFNHAGAVRSFREAQRLDPKCALCWWGEALALGPNINAPMEDRDRNMALRALARAQALRGQASPLEQGLIDAVAKRYSRDPKSDRAALDAAYADAMIALAHRFADQDDVAVLAAEAIMDTTAWNYWQADKRTPVGRSGEAVRLVETVLARNIRHPQANHLYIHLMEAAQPRRAEAAADRLAPLAPHAGHLVHMPAHIYQLVGRHADSIRTNVAAARADEEFIKATNDHSLVRYGYYPHNIHFIVTSAQMVGDMKTAIAEAGRLRTILDPATSARIGWVQAIDAAPFLAMAQFAAPEAILAMPEPDARLPYAAAMRHYARAVAFAQRKDGAGVTNEIAAMEALRHSPAIADLVSQGVPVSNLIGLAHAVAQGRLAFARERYDEAAAHYRAAIVIEGKIPYQEPSYWYYPVSQSLGAALLRAGKPEEASQAFQAALVQTPSNGWALYGLAQSEQARGASLEAAAARKALDRVWLGDRAWLNLSRL
ncbi:MAG: tetratricopeptide repeat protein [Pseudomonadota bacterium]